MIKDIHVTVRITDKQYKMCEKHVKYLKKKMGVTVSIGAVIRIAIENLEKNRL